MALTTTSLKLDAEIKARMQQYRFEADQVVLLAVRHGRELGY